MHQQLALQVQVRVSALLLELLPTLLQCLVRLALVCLLQSLQKQQRQQQQLSLMVLPQALLLAQLLALLQCLVRLALVCLLQSLQQQRQQQQQRRLEWQRHKPQLQVEPAAALLPKLLLGRWQQQQTLQWLLQKSP
jgi:hypothetical protein